MVLGPFCCPLVHRVFCFFLLAAFFSSHKALALNGLRPIGVSAASRALGGTGVATYHNHYEATYKNPALMSFSPLESGQYQASFALTYGNFMPRVKATYGDDQEFKTPTNRASGIFPSVLGIGKQLTSQVSFGLGAYGGGGGADYRDAPSVYRSKSRTAAVSLISGLSYRLFDNVSVGLSVNGTFVDVIAENDSVTTGERTRTGGAASTLSFLFGASYKKDSLTFGATIGTPATARINDARDIDEDGKLDNLLFTAIPLEAALGISYSGSLLSLYADYRFLNWSKAEFLNSVGWKDQHVLALGLSYGRENKLRMGMNLATKTVTDVFDQDGFATTKVSDLPLINLAGDAFVATSGIGVTTRHYTLGSFHKVSDSLSIETAYVYMAQGSIERSGSYEVPTGRKEYGWRSEFFAQTLQVEMGYVF